VKAELSSHGSGRWSEDEKKPRGVGAQEAKEMGARWQENRSVDLCGRFGPLFILPGKRQPIGRGAWCPHLTLNLPDTGKGAQVLLFSKHESAKW
jgi:hypothetical protein